MNAKLARLRREVAKEGRARRRALRRVVPPAPRSLWREGLILVANAAVLGALPFYALIRGSVYLHETSRLPAWLALLAGGGLTIGLIAAYGTCLVRRVTGRLHVAAVTKWIASPVVVFYLAYALVYLSSLNAKSPEVRAYYTSVHPLLRVALATAILADRDIVITDLARTPRDYARMGLPENERTLHYRQRDGYVHAVDLRTAGHGEIRNRLVQLYFWTMGFDTLRHVGTADHLHVSLPAR